MVCIIKALLGVFGSFASLPDSLDRLTSFLLSILDALVFGPTSSRIVLYGNSGQGFGLRLSLSSFFSLFGVVGSPLSKWSSLSVEYWKLEGWFSACVLSNPGSKLVSPGCPVKEWRVGEEVDPDLSFSSEDAGVEGWLNVVGECGVGSVRRQQAAMNM